MSSKRRRGLVGCSTSWRFSSWLCGGPIWLPATGGCLQGAPWSLGATWRQPCGWALPRRGSTLSSVSSPTGSSGAASAPHSSTAENPGYQGNPTALYEGFAVAFFLIYVSISLIDLDVGSVPLYSALSLSISLLFILQFSPLVPPSANPFFQRWKVDDQSRGSAGGDWVWNVSNMEAEGNGKCAGGLSGSPSCVYVLVNRRCWKAMPMQRSKKLEKRKETIWREQWKLNLFLWIIWRCVILWGVKMKRNEKKKKRQNKETIPLKESLEMFYIFKSCTKKKM